MTLTLPTLFSDGLKRNSLVCLQAMCWGVVLFSLVDSSLYALATRALFAEIEAGEIVGYCGNAVTDGLRCTLNVEVPLVAMALFALFRLGQQSRPTSFLLFAVSTVCVGNLICFLIFGLDYYSNALADSGRFFEEIWWLNPVAWLWV